MTAKEKAINIRGRFYKHTVSEDKKQQLINSKICALICVDEMLKQPQTSDKQLNFLIEVKQEINKL
tara:strand:+ start:79 stop:276 length:198 start_codon:yes stop_codon:yes gene_type:complete